MAPETRHTHGGIPHDTASCHGCHTKFGHARSGSLAACHSDSQTPGRKPQSVSVPYVRDLRDCIRGAHARVRQATQATAKTQKQYYDKRVSEKKFQTGQLVWLYWPNPPVRQKFKKLQQVWTGPWRIVEFKTDVVVIIQHTQKRTKQTVHVNRLTPCTSPEPQNLTTFDPPPEEPLAA